MDQLQQHVSYIAEMLSNPSEVPPEGATENEDGTWVDEDGEEVDLTPPSAMDWLEDALDIEYIVGSDRRYLGARVLVTCGGPNIWVNTRTRTVEGYWWTDHAEASFTDNLGLDQALEELWNCL